MSSIKISDYLEKSSDRRGVCKDCGSNVFWSVANLASHKRKNCTIPEEELPLWVDPYVTVSLKKIDDYLENKNPVTRRGTCKSCGVQVYWTNLHLSSHKRSKCNISDDERMAWDPKITENAGKKRRLCKNILNISEYLQNKDEITRKGECKLCGKDVNWSFHQLVRHKRKKCVASETTNQLWLEMEKHFKTNVPEKNVPTQTEARVSSTDIISEYLKDKNTATRRGTCRVCFASIFWTITHLSQHKQRKCPIPEVEKESWMNLKQKLAEAKLQCQNVDINIGDYLTDKNTLARRGTCKVCQKRVYWATLHLVSHKKSKCPISKEEKKFWSTIKRGNSISFCVEKSEESETEENLKQNDFQMSEDDAEMDEETTMSMDFESPDIQETPKSQFMCLQCDKTFKSKKGLIAHEKSHENSLICDHCNKFFATKHALKIHIFSHLKETTTKNYKDLRENYSNVNKLVEMFEVIPDDHSFEEVIIKQENAYTQETSDETPIHHFTCCDIEFPSFIELSAHQYTNHLETFRMMLDSMKDEIFNEICQLLSVEKIPVTEVETPSNDTDSHQSETEFDDEITSNVNVECFICQTELPAYKYDKHLSTIHPLEDAAKAKAATTKFCCNCCSQTFTSVSLCVSHLKQTWHQFSGTSCNICNEGEFENLRDLNLHRKLNHSRTKEPTCEICQKTFKRVKDLKFHELEHKGEKREFCSICGYKTVSRELMIKHMKKHENEPDCICPYCGLAFKGNLKLSRHVRDRHTHVKTPAEKLKPLPCKLCDTVCFGRDRLNNHIKKLHREWKFKCDACEKSFLSERLLSLHRVTHTQEISFFCDFCGKGFTRLSTLKKHEKIHDESTLKYFCEECSKGFRDKRDLVRHTKVHIGQRDVKCSKCTAGFFDRSQLNKHMIKAHGEGLPDYKSTKINVAYKRDLE